MTQMFDAKSTSSQNLVKIDDIYLPNSKKDPKPHTQEQVLKSAQFRMTEDLDKRITEAKLNNMHITNHNTIRNANSPLKLKYSQKDYSSKSEAKQGNKNQQQIRINQIDLLRDSPMP